MNWQGFSTMKLLTHPPLVPPSQNSLGRGEKVRKQGSAGKTTCGSLFSGYCRLKYSQVMVIIDSR